MEDWRVKALECFPDLAEVVVAEEGGPVGLWIELFFQMTLAYEKQPIDDDLIGRIYDYAGWCINLTCPLFPPTS